MKNKRIIIIPIVLFLIILALVVCVYCVSINNHEENYITSVYNEYTKMSRPTIDRNAIIYRIDYLDYITEADKYELEVDKEGNYGLTYIKYNNSKSKIGQNHYFNGTLSENDFEMFKQILGQMDRYLEGIKKDYKDFEFYYSSDEVKEQNENGNKLLKAVMTEIINHTIYNKEGNRVSNFNEINSIIDKYIQNPDMDLDAELVLNEKGSVREEKAPQFGTGDGEKESQASQDEHREQADQESQVNQAKGGSSEENKNSGNSAFSNIPLATGKKSESAKLDRIIIDFKDGTTDEEIAYIVGCVSSGILFRFETGNRFIIATEQYGDENQVTELCKNIKNTYESVENAELCYE